MNKVLLLIGGTVNLLFGIFHLLLGKALNWTETLSCLSLDNRATVYTLNVHLAYTCLVFAFLSLLFWKDLLSKGVGRVVTTVIGLYWILRAVNQVIYNGLSAPDTSFWVILCLLVSLLYIIPALRKQQAIEVVSTH